MEIKGELESGESGGLDFFFFLEIIFFNHRTRKLENCKVEKSRIGISKCISVI